MGSRISKREPLPTSLVTSICPPCDSTVRRANDSPSPVPCPLVVKNGRKMLGRFSGANSLAFVGDGDQHGILVSFQQDADGSWLVHGLNCVQQQVKQHLIDLVGIVIHGRDRPG